MTRLLITGPCGFLGAHLVEHFLKNTDFEIVGLDRLSYASSGFDRLRDIKAYDDKRVHIIGCDLSHPLPEGVVKEVGDVDYVIHAAAETHVDNSIIDPVPFIQSNVMGTHNLLWWAKVFASNVKRIFLVSTDEVYGPASWDAPGNIEDDTYRPANPYAAAKAGGEMLAFAYANTYRLPLTIVNTMNLYGERQGAEKFIPLVIRRVLEGEKILIHADPTKTRAGTRFYIHCRNYASALSFLIERDRNLAVRRKLINNRIIPADEPKCVHDAELAAAQMPSKIHVAGELEVSNLDLAQTIADILGKPLKYEMVDFHSSRPGHDLRYALDDTLIRQMGWKQPVDFKASLERTVRWFVANPRWLNIGIKKD